MSNVSDHGLQPQQCHCQAQSEDYESTKLTHAKTIYGHGPLRLRASGEGQLLH